MRQEIRPGPRNLEVGSTAVTAPSTDHAARLLATLPRPGSVVFLGTNDSGKTTWTRALANAAAAAGVAVAVVDADVGQSEIGPPGTVALAHLREPVDALDTLRPSAMTFVGSVTPVGHLLPLVVGTKRLVERARARGAELVLVDTSGLVEGELGRTLKLHKLDLLAPDVVIALERGNELVPLLRLLAASPARLERLPVDPSASRKPPALRRARRQARMSRYLAGARRHEIDLQTLPAAGAWLFTGETLAPRFLRFAEQALGAAVLHGERLPDAVRLVVRGSANPAGADLIREELRRPRVLLTPAHALQGLMVGLLDAEGWTMGVGLIEEVRYDAARLIVRVPLPSVASARQLRFGRLRLRPDGSEIGPVRPGEL